MKLPNHLFVYGPQGIGKTTFIKENILKNIEPDYMFKIGKIEFPYTCFFDHKKNVLTVHIEEVKSLEKAREITRGLSGFRGLRRHYQGEVYHLYVRFIFESNSVFGKVSDNCNLIEIS